MADAASIVEHAPVQDRDLLQRLSLYFDAFDARLRQGQGWFIFNAAPGRSTRISAFIQHRLGELDSDVSSYVMPWRDFALSAYVHEVGLPKLAPAVEDEMMDGKARREYELATQITRNTYDQMISTDLLVLVGLKPAHRHEAHLLDQTIDGRYRQRLATILLTPDMPQELEAEFQTVDPTRTYWERLFRRMYETSLVAL
ncbi:MAG: hypothetical protein M3Q71_11845 [Chloroflexota bacterium]|nr:hypothetical protein [Chloroflexota bacterium]MDP9471340.1 hypothetical protein [Chloroflexota bacterium]